MGLSDGFVDNIVVDLPPGFVGNPQAVAECSQEQFAIVPPRCPPASQVGVLNLHMQAASFGENFGPLGWDAIYPVWNLEPLEGRVAELGFAYASGEKATSVRLTARVRTSSDFGVTAFVGQISAALPLSSQAITLWGVPWAAENDLWRAQEGLVPGVPDEPCNVQPETGNTGHYIPPGGLSPACRAVYEESWGSVRPFLVQETDCNQAPVVGGWMDSYQHPGSFDSEGRAVADPDWVRAFSPSPAVTGCEKLDFDPALALAPSTTAADAASGLSATLAVPQNFDPPPAVAHDPGVLGDRDAGAPGHWRSDAGLATAHLKDSVVTLPAGFSVNPSAAAGLQGCSDAQIGVRGTDPGSGRLLFNDGDPYNKDSGADGAECPDAAKIGTVRVETPLLGNDVHGDVVLGMPKSTDPMSGEMFRLFLVLRDPRHGLVAKIYGSSTADPADGQLTARFQNNPEVPFDKLTLDVKSGARGMLATPPRCASHGWSASFAPWSSVGAPVGTVSDADRGGAMATNANCAFAFSPGLVAGTTDGLARASRPFTVRITRPEGDQTVRGASVRMPGGLLASLRGVTRCSVGQAAANACPASSRIGFVDGAAGSGVPFVLERKGDVFLTDGYRGAPFGLSISVPVEAGPFRGPLALSPIHVRAALHVDRSTARVTAVADPLPQVWHGVPLRVREIVTSIDRPGFMLNPSGCATGRIETTLTSAAGATATPSMVFQPTGCARLGFKPRLAIRLTGRKQARTGRHPGVKAQVTQKGISEAGIDSARVVLPKSLALDPNNAQALCEFADGTKPDLESHCPKGSIVGRARAVTPLLDKPLAGNVYFVKNVRTDPETGNEIRTLPMIIVALRGEIAINLKGESATTKAGRLVNTFAAVPDAPVSRFNLNIKGGRNGILAVTRTRRAKINLCTRPRSHKATTRMTGHNGRQHNPTITLKTPCTKRKAKQRRDKRR
jgi:hypothetical protein